MYTEDWDVYEYYNLKHNTIQYQSVIQVISLLTSKTQSVDCKSSRKLAKIIWMMLTISELEMGLKITPTEVRQVPAQMVCFG